MLRAWAGHPAPVRRPDPHRGGGVPVPLGDLDIGDRGAHCLAAGHIGHDDVAKDAVGANQNNARTRTAEVLDHGSAWLAVRRDECSDGRYSLRRGGASSVGGDWTLLGHTESLGRTTARFGW